MIVACILVLFIARVVPAESNEQITRSGIPMQRRSKQQSSYVDLNDEDENRFIASREATQQFYTHYQHSSQSHNKKLSKSDSAQRRREAEQNLLRAQNGETFKSLDVPKLKHKKNSYNSNNSRDNNDNKQYTVESKQNGRHKGGSHHEQARHNDKYHCDICRRLNKNRAEGEPDRYCWERYYAVSSSTPQTSMA